MKLDPAKIKKDPVYFTEKVVGMKLTSYQKEWMRLAELKKKVVIMAFRSSGKTRQLIVNYAIWNAVTRPVTEYLIISKTLPQAIKILKDVRITILTSPLLKTLVPSNRSQSWSRTEIELANRSSIKCRAYNDNIRGEHVHGVLCDEMGEYDDHEVLKKAVMPTLRAKRGFFVGLGTPKSELDLLHEVERNPGFSMFHFDRFPAEGDKGDLFLERYPDTTIEHRDGAVFVMDKKTKKVIESYNTLAWSQEFLLKPLSTKDKLFPEHMVEACLDPSQTLREGPENMKQYFMGADFAMSAQSGSDYTVITVLEKSPGSQKLTLVHMDRFRGLDYTLQKQRIKEVAQKYQIVKALGDENSFGRIFIYDLKAEGIPIEGYKFTYHSGSKDELIKSLRDQFEKEGFVLPYSDSDVKTRTMVQTLVTELTKFGIIFDMKSKVVKFQGTGEHDDCVISLALATFIARHISMACFSAIKGSQKHRSPFIVAAR